ncbi:hypothetical protein AVEN_192569-1 [Araneus ventricosus]|uniref:Uncharacterized protein n=1 Tax=Araneus ventricosus TaxID=182803 RepID=A0A4Y2WZZ4_ARAVE|nr:hypothetical protein AVEN_192569-1 [Araneus ventricosus]
MLQLENLIDPSVFRRFIQGFLTVRLSAKFSCGTSTDMIIEQSLMKSMQTDGGISRGRSTQESVISKRVYSMHAMNTVCERLEDLGNIKMDTADKHVNIALEKFNTNTTIVVDEDVDLLITLIARTPTDRIIYFLKPVKAQIETKMYSSQSLSSFTKCQAHISFLHAITGCDTTSAFFKRRKTKEFKLFVKRHDLIDCAEVFTNIGSSPDITLTNGTRFLLAMYGAPNKIASIDKYRYLTFVKNTSNNKLVQLSCLPPTFAAAYQHLCRVYYQVQVCLGNHLFQKNFSILFFVIARRVVIINVAVKKSDCFVHKYVVIAKASLTLVLNQIQ